MTRFLPPRPSLDHLKNEAKALHKAHQQHKPEACPVLRHVHRFHLASDEEIFSADVALTECQFALAQEYGFSGWQALRRTVQGLYAGADYHPQAGGDALVLPDVPPGGYGQDQHTVAFFMDRYAAAFSMLFTYLGAPVDYQTVMGDSGLAFIFQADAQHKPHGANVRQLDLGWWPLDPWGAKLRLQFLGEVYGIQLRVLQTMHAEYQHDPALHYRTYHETEIIDNLLAGRPGIGVWDYDIHLIVGYDNGNPPLLGQWSCVDHVDVQRLEHFPYDVFVPGEPRQRITRREADRQALAFAVALGCDEVDLANLPGKSSGQRSWKLWAAQLVDAELCGPDFFHANVRGNLYRRGNAAGYLRAMQSRTPPTAGDMLLRAANCYDELVATIQRMEISKEALSTADGRTRLVELIHTAGDFDARAIDMLSKALDVI